MGWVCDYCSSVNENGNTHCFVCGKERSKESIREEKRAVRTQKLQTAYRKAILVNKVSFFSSLSLFSVFLIVTLALKVRSGSTEEFFSIGEALLDVMAKNVKRILDDNPAYLFQNTFAASFERFGNAFVGLFPERIILDNFGIIPFAAVFEAWGEKFAGLFGNLNVCVSELVERLTDFGLMVCTLVPLFYERAINVPNNFTEIKNTVFGKF